MCKQTRSIIIYVYARCWCCTKPVYFCLFFFSLSFFSFLVSFLYIKHNFFCLFFVIHTRTFLLKRKLNLCIFFFLMGWLLSCSMRAFFFLLLLYSLIWGDLRMFDFYYRMIMKTTTTQKKRNVFFCFFEWILSRD